MSFGRVAPGTRRKWGLDEVLGLLFIVGAGRVFEWLEEEEEEEESSSASSSSSSIGDNNRANRRPLMAWISKLL